MNMQFHLIMQNGVLSVRKPDLTAKKYDSKTMIGTHEVRQFLEPLGPYALVNVDNQAEASLMIRGEYVYKVKGDELHPLWNSKWYVAGGYVRDDGAVFVMLPEKITDKQFFSRLGLHVDLLKKWSNSFKVGKYLKRLFSHHYNYMQGEVIRESGDVIWVKLATGTVLSVRYAEGGVLTDGMNLVSTACVNKLGFIGKEGTGLRITALSPRGFSKGHAIVKDDLQFDLVLFDSKQLLKGDRFTFALDGLHKGNLFTDTQSVINFRMYEKPFLEEWAEKYMREVIEAVQDEDKLKKMLQFYRVEFHMEQEGDESEYPGTYLNYIEKEVDWALLRALRAGIPITTHPALVRKLFNLFIRRIMDCETKIRIPVPEEVGEAHYLLVDPTIFDRLGNPSLPGVLHGNEVYVHNHKGEVVYHRQPNAHRGEHVISMSVNPPELRAYDNNGTFMFVSRDIIEPACITLGGGDQDDRVVVYKDLEVVNHFKSLEAYPLMVTEKPILPVLKENRFAGLLPRAVPVYDRYQIDMMLSQQEQQRTSIGQAVNPLMMDTAITDQKEVILKYLNEIPKDLKIVDAISKMKAFAGNMLKLVASQLEMIIDAVKKDGGDVSAIAEEIREFWKWIPVIPEFALRGGFMNMGRLPASRRGENHPVVVHTDIDSVLDEIAQARVELEDHITAMSWQMVPPVPLEIVTYPIHDDATQLAIAMRTYYHARREALLPIIDESDVKGRIKALIQCDKDVFDTFKSNPLVLDAMVELYGRIYSKRLPEAPINYNTGRPRPFADGLIWGPRMGGLMVKALDLCEMTKRYAKVIMDKGMKKYNRGTYNVVVNKGVVTLEGDNIIIGTTDRGLVGTMEMSHGLIGAPASIFGEVPMVERPITLTVVAGWSTRPDSTPEAIADWKSKVNASVVLKPIEMYEDKDGRELEDPEHAVQVLLDGVLYGYITKGEAHNIIKKTEGWLVKGNTPLTMRVLVTVKKVE